MTKRVDETASDEGRGPAPADPADDPVTHPAPDPVAPDPVADDPVADDPGAGTEAATIAPPPAEHGEDVPALDPDALTGGLVGCVVALARQVELLTAATNGFRVLLTDRFFAFEDVVARTWNSQVDAFADYRRGVDEGMTELRRLLAEQDAAVRRVAAQLDALPSEASLASAVHSARDELHAAVADSAATTTAAVADAVHDAISDAIAEAAAGTRAAVEDVADDVRRHVDEVVARTVADGAARVLRDGNRPDEQLRAQVEVVAEQLRELRDAIDAVAARTQDDESLALLEALTSSVRALRDTPVAPASLDPATATLVTDTADGVRQLQDGVAALLADRTESVSAATAATVTELVAAVREVQRDLTELRGAVGEVAELAEHPPAAPPAPAIELPAIELPPDPTPVLEELVDSVRQLQDIVGDLSSVEPPAPAPAPVLDLPPDPTPVLEELVHSVRQLQDIVGDLPGELHAALPAAGAGDERAAGAAADDANADVVATLEVLVRSVRQLQDIVGDLSAELPAPAPAAVAAPAAIVEDFATIVHEAKEAIAAEVAELREDVVKLKRRIPVRAASSEANLSDDELERIATAVVERLERSFEVVDDDDFGGPAAPAPEPEPAPAPPARAGRRTRRDGPLRPGA